MANRAVIIGCGGVGAAIGYSIMMADVMKEVVFIDPVTDRMEGEVLDIDQGIGHMSNTVIRSGDYSDCGESDVIILTAGRNRRPGETRRDLLEGNKKILCQILEDIRPYYNNNFMIIISNPVDALTRVAYECGWIPADKLCGTGCLLDTSRWICEIAKYLKADKKEIVGWSVGEHGSNQHIIWDSVRVAGETIEDYSARNGIVWNDSVKEQLQKNVTEMGAAIIARKGRTQYGIAGVTTYLVKSLLGHEKTPVSVSCKVDPETDQMVSAVVYVADGQIWYEDK